MEDNDTAERGSRILADPSGEESASVVVIDRDADLATICGRVDSAPTFAVVLRVPRGNPVLASEYGMRRVLRHAEESGHTIAVATGSRSLVGRAVSSRVPVARRPKDVRWDAPGRTIFKLGRVSLALPTLGPWPGVLAIAVGLGLMFAAVLFIVPTATVIVTLPADEVSEETEVRVVDAISSADPAAGILAARTVNYREVMLIAVKTTGETTVATSSARASVVITAPESGVEIPAGSVLIAGDVRFRLDDDVSIGPSSSGSAGVTAIAPGPAGNVEAGAISRWESPAYDQAAVTNPAGAAGGESELRPAVSLVDMISAVEQATALAAAESIRGRLAAARPGHLVIDDSVTVTVLPRPANVGIGSAADFLLLEVDLLFEGLAVPEESLLQLAEAVLAKDGRIVLAGTVTVEQIERVVKTEDSGMFALVRISGQVVPSVDPEGVKSAVKGKRPSSAEETLFERYRMEDVDVRLTPGWAPFVPRFGWRIDVDVRGTSGAAIEPVARAGPR